MIKIVIFYLSKSRGRKDSNWFENSSEGSPQDLWRPLCRRSETRDAGAAASHEPKRISSCCFALFRRLPNEATYTFFLPSRLPTSSPLITHTAHQQTAG